MVQAGYGMAALTPPLGAELAGYGYYLKRRAQRVDDPTYARALALRQGETTHLLVSCDILGLSNEIAARVRQEMREKHGISPALVILVSTHTHTAAPAVYHEGCGEVDPDYVPTIAPAIIRACEEALSNLTPVTGMGYSCADIGGRYAYNRACPEGPVDKIVRSFAIHRQGADEIVLFSYACHGVCNGRSTGISADYPGHACREMRERTGALPLFINGLCGDIDPVPCKAQDRQESRRRFAQAIVQAACQEKQALPLTVSGGCLQTVLRLKPVTLASIHEAADRAVQSGQTIPGGDIVARVWEKEMIEKFHTLSDTEQISVRYLILGGVPIVALPFEGFTAVGDLIRRESGAPNALTLGCADQLLGYLPTMDDIARGAYAALESTFLYKRLPIFPGEAERLGKEIGLKMRRQ